MGIRFRKSLKLAPGVKLNLNKKSTSVTLGGKECITRSVPLANTQRVLASQEVVYTILKQLLKSKIHLLYQCLNRGLALIKIKKAWMFILFTCIFSYMYGHSDLFTYVDSSDWFYSLLCYKK